MPDLTCDSGYARQNTFDPERQGPICLTKEEIQQTASGGNPGATIPDKRCASGYAYASAEKATTYGSNAVCVTVDELSEFKRRTALTPNVDGSLKETRLAGRVDVKIHEFDSEGGEHVRTVGVPLDEKVEGGALNYGKKQLLKLKLRSLIRARNSVRSEFGERKNGEAETIFHGIHHDPARIHEDGSYWETLSRTTPRL